MILSAEQLHGLIASIRDRQIAIVEAVGVRAVSLQLTPGEQVQAEVIARLPSGQSLANIGGQTFSLPLPAGVKPGETVRLTYLSGEPRLTFALSQSERQGTPTVVSDTARWLGQITRDQSLPASPLPRPSQLLTAPPTDPRLIATQLRQVVANSGLFYESHLAEWATGERPLPGLLQEPQGSLSQPAAFQKAMASGAAVATTTATPMPTTPAAAAPSLLPDKSTGVPPAPLPAPGPMATDAAGIMAKTGAAEIATPTPGPHPQGTAAAPTTTSPAPPSLPPAPATATPLPGAPAPSPPSAPAAAPIPTPLPAAGTTSPLPAATLPNPAPPLPPTGVELPTATATAAPPKPQAPQSPGEQPNDLAPLHEPIPPRPPTNAATAMRPTIEPARFEPAGQTQGAAAMASDNRGPVGDAAKTGGATVGPEPADPRTIPLIREQLELLQTRTFSWQGEGWPGQPLEWRVEEREASPGDAAQRAWTSTLHLALPHLGELDAGIQLVGKTLQITINGKSLATVQALRASSQALREQVEASGLLLTSLEVQHE